MTQTFVKPIRKPDFEDCYEGKLGNDEMSAKDLYMYCMTHTPAWFDALMWLRQKLVKMVGFKTSVGDGDDSNLMTKLPVVRETPDEYCVGISDRHLDFTLTVKRQAAAKQTPLISVGTDIWFNAWYGQLYLLIVLPFHKLIINHMLAKLEQSV